MTRMDTRLEEPLAFIGGGNMARALIAGLVANGLPTAALRVGEPMAAPRDALVRDFPGLIVTPSNATAVAGAGSWIFAVKPQQMAAVAVELAPVAAAERPLVVSLAAGIRVAALESWLGGHATIVRSMPNCAAMFGAGITGLYTAPATATAARDRAERLFRTVGDTVWLPAESDLDAVTAISGSGPAYVFLLIEMLEAAALAEGLAADVARRLAVATAAGAARMAQQSGSEPATLRERVTSPAGTTAAALAVLEAADIRATFLRAVRAARRRAAELAAQFGD